MAGTVDVQTATTIAAPIERVAAFAAEPGNAPRWYVNIGSVEHLTDPPLRVGSQAQFVATFLGRRLEYVYEVIDYEPGQRIVMSSASGPFPMETTYTWESVPGGTLMTLRNHGQPEGFSRHVSSMMGSIMRRANRNDLDLLKSILEKPA